MLEDKNRSDIIIDLYEKEHRAIAMVCFMQLEKYEHRQVQRKKEIVI